MRIALEMHVEFADGAWPAFSPSHETAKIGADNPDNLYQYARLDGRCEYRVTGRRGTVAYLSFGTQKGGYETDGKMLQTGFLDAKQLEIATDGSFEIVLSETPRGQRAHGAGHQRVAGTPDLPRPARGNAGTTEDRAHRQRRSPGAPRPARAAGLTRRAVRRADVEAVRGLGRELPVARERCRPPTRRCASRSAAIRTSITTTRWSLADDEALVIDVDTVPDCDFWNVQLNNYWMESLDYRHFDICVNKHSARRNADGGDGGRRGPRGQVTRTGSIRPGIAPARSAGAGSAPRSRASAHAGGEVATLKEAA